MASNQIPQTSLQKKVKVLMLEYGITNIWMSLYQTSRDYTNFSHAHTLYSKIYNFLLLKKITIGFVTVRWATLTSMIMPPIIKFKIR